MLITVLRHLFSLTSFSIFRQRSSKGFNNCCTKSLYRPFINADSSFHKCSSGVLIVNNFNSEIVMRKRSYVHGNPEDRREPRVSQLYYLLMNPQTWWCNCIWFFIRFRDSSLRFSNRGSVFSPVNDIGWPWSNERIVWFFFYLFVPLFDKYCSSANEMNEWTNDEQWQHDSTTARLLNFLKANNNKRYHIYDTVLPQHFSRTC